MDVKNILKKEIEKQTDIDALKLIAKNKTLPLNKRIAAGRLLKNMGVNYYV